MNRSSRLLIPLMALLAACSGRWSGFESLPNGWHRRLDRFGDCGLPVEQAAFSLITFEVYPLDAPDSLLRMTIHSGRLPDSTEAEGTQELYGHLRQMGCGDQVSLGMPWADLRRQWIGTFLDSAAFEPEREMVLAVRADQTFTADGFFQYLQAAAQQGEMEEEEAIRLALMNEERMPEEHGKVLIMRDYPGEGDTVRSGREISIRYHTYLLNGTELDSLTEMRFPFGKPGQVIPGLQYGLSFLREGESARIYMPSRLAFGEEGSSTGVVPRNTPVYFEVKVLDVE